MCVLLRMLVSAREERQAAYRAKKEAEGPKRRKKQGQGGRVCPCMCVLCAPCAVCVRCRFCVVVDVWFAPVCSDA